MPHCSTCARVRTGKSLLLDWEDVSAAPAALDLAWLLVSSVDPEKWDDVIAAYGSADGLADALCTYGGDLTAGAATRCPTCPI